MIKQGTDEWHNARLAKVTASRLSAVMAKTKSGYSATRKNYMMELICQKLSGQREESYTNTAMQRGNDLEPIARGAYEADKGVFVDEVGLILHPAEIDFAASPDGLVGNDGLVEQGLEYKCVRVEFDKVLADEIIKEVTSFLVEMEKELIEINKMREK